MDELNTFSDNLKTLIESGYVKNGRQFLGVTGSGILQVNDFMGVSKPFKVETERPAIDAFPLAPVIAIHNFQPNRSPLAGGSRKGFTFTVEMFFPDGFTKTISGTPRKADRLARYFMTEMADGLYASNVAGVSSINQLPGLLQSGRVQETNIYGFTLRFEVVLA